jgi:hypothetical protein
MLNARVFRRVERRKCLYAGAVVFEGELPVLGIPKEAALDDWGRVHLCGHRRASAVEAAAVVVAVSDELQKVGGVPRRPVLDHLDDDAPEGGLEHDLRVSIVSVFGWLIHNVSQNPNV